MKGIGLLLVLGVIAYVAYGFFLASKDSQHTQAINNANRELSAAGEVGNLPFQNSYGDKLKKWYPWFPG